jgi:hypothetical protein
MDVRGPKVTALADGLKRQVEVRLRAQINYLAGADRSEVTVLVAKV